MQKPFPDLQLLSCLEALVRERQVSRAAEKIGLSQSSMSEALGRLRNIFGDPLLVRGREGMVPTPRALELLPRVRDLLEQSEALLDSSDAFEPKRETRVFRLIASDYTQFMLMPRLMAELNERAPECAIDVLTVNVRDIDGALESGDADVAVGLVPEPSVNLRRRFLFRERSVCVARRGHPAVTGALSPAQFSTLAHIHVAPSGLRYFSQALDDALGKHGLVRRVIFTSSHFLLAAHVVTETDAVVFLPQRIALRLAETLPLIVIEPPVDLPSYEIAMLWHERVHASPAHSWARQLIAQLLC